MSLGRREHYYEVILTKPDKSKAWTGKGPTEKAARKKAQSLVKRSGEGLASLEESVHSFVGPAPRTFEGNRGLPK